MVISRTTVKIKKKRSNAARQLMPEPLVEVNYYCPYLDAICKE
jgi:hypothetical protein